MPQLGELFDLHFLERLEALHLQCRKPRWGTRAGGPFTVNRRGSSIEFADYAEYHWGDDFRAIDWNLYGRLERLFVKTFKEDVELNVHIVVDATASMALPHGEKKWTYVKDVATALAYVGLANHNLVRLSAFGASSVHLLMTTYFQRRHGIFACREFLDRLTPASEISFAAWIERYVYATHARGGTILLLSDWMMEPAEWVRGLQFCNYHNLDVKVIQVLTPPELKPGQGWRQGYVVDVETGARRTLWDMRLLLRAMEAHNAQLASFCHRNGFLFVQVSTALPFEELILRELPRMGLVV